MEIYVYDLYNTDKGVFNVKFEGIVDQFSSFIWIRKYNDIGTFELHAPLTQENINLLTIGRVISRELWNNQKEGGIIESRTLSVAENGKEELVIKGHFLTQILNRRIAKGRYKNHFYRKGKVYEIIQEMIKANFTEALSTPRQVKNITCTYDTSLENDTELTVLEYGSTHKELLKEVLSLCQESDIGIKSELDHESETINFKLYKGRDLSEIVVFSRDYENVLSEVFTEGNNEYKNMAYVGGEGEGEERAIGAVNEWEMKGLNRRECFVDARDLRKEDLEVDETLLDFVYNKILVQRGKEKLADFPEIVNFEGIINPHANYEYGIDYELGDKILIMDNLFNLKMKVRITEITEVYENGARTIEVGFGTPILSLINKIEKM